MTIEEGIERLHTSIKRLKVHYDMYFAGSLPRQPYELRREVELLIRNLSATRIRKYQLRFHLNTLVGRYNTMSELWAKQLRAFETRGRASLQSSAPKEPSGRRAAEIAEEVLYSVRVSDPTSEPESMRQLYERYVEARNANDVRPPIQLESFVRQIVKQASAMKETSGCSMMEFRILRKGETISLKARAASQEP